MDPLQDITSQINIPLPDPNQFFATQNDETYQVPALTEETAALCGAQIPKNTSRSNDTALKAFAAFIVEHLELLTPQNIAIIKDANCRSQQRCSLNDQSIRLTHLYVFRDSDGTVPCRGNFNWTDHQLKRLNRLLVLFVAHYKKRGMKQDIMPTTLKAYIIGLQRASTSTFGYKFRLLTDKPFSDMENGLLTVVDNKIRKQQAEGVTRKNHNVLTGDMIRDLYSSSALSKGHAKGFCTRMIFDIAFMTSFRPTELSNIRVEDVTCFQSEDGDAWRIVGRIGDLGGASKTQGGGLKYVNVKPKEVLVWNKIQLDGHLNVYEDIQEYLELIKRIRSPKDKFFTAINYKSTIGIPETFFKAMNLGSGVREKMTLHGLRGTVITQLFESGHAESSVALRSGHRGMEAMKAYQYLRGRLGMKQQEDILDGKYGKIGQEKRRKMNSYNSITTENKENSIPIVSLPVESAGFGMTRSRKEIEFLTGVGTVSGPITINLNYYRDKGEERDVEGDDEEVSKVLR